MLTFSQIRTDAFMEAGDFEMYCERCAAEKWGALFIARLEAGLEEPVIEMSGPSGTTSYSPSPYPSARVRTVSGYELGEHESNEAWALAESYAEEDGYKQGDRVLTDVHEIYAAMEEDGAFHIECAGSCGRVYTGGAQPWQKPNEDGSIPEYVRSVDDTRWTGI